jgi:hypothetical protein
LLAIVAHEAITPDVSLANVRRFSFARQACSASQIRRGPDLVLRENQPPTLAEIGLSKKESALAQKIAAFRDWPHAQKIIRRRLQQLDAGLSG